MSGKEIHDDMLATLGNNASSYTLVKSWIAEFKCERNIVSGEHCSGRPKDADAASAKNIQVVNDTL